MKFLLVPPENLVVIDNATVNGIVIPIDVALVIWNGSSGEIEPKGGMPVRTTFSDLSPYVPYLNAFIGAPLTITQLPLLDVGMSLPLKLVQAKQIKSDMIDALFDYKRQVQIAWSSWWWDAADESYRAMLLTLLPSQQQEVTLLVNAVNSQMSTYSSNLAYMYNGYIGSFALSYPSSYDTFGRSFNTNGTNYGFGVWSPTVGGGLPGNPAWYQNATSAVGVFNMGGIGQIADPAPNLGSVSWLPINSASAISITYSQLNTIVKSIAARRDSLQTVRANKKTAVAALSTVAAVAAYDVLAGW